MKMAASRCPHHIASQALMPKLGVVADHQRGFYVVNHRTSRTSAGCFCGDRRLRYYFSPPTEILA
jgi:hypothetical protein